MVIIWLVYRIYRHLIGHEYINKLERLKTKPQFKAACSYSTGPMAVVCNDILSPEVQYSCSTLYNSFRADRYGIEQTLKNDMVLKTYSNYNPRSATTRVILITAAKLLVSRYRGVGSEAGGAGMGWDGLVSVWRAFQVTVRSTRHCSRSEAVCEFPS